MAKKDTENEKARAVGGKGITADKHENFSEWYTQLLKKADFAEYSDISGAQILKPWAYAAWKMIMDVTDAEFKKAGIEDVYFPLFIPERLLEKEKEHFKGFSPEVAWVTEGGESKLGERLAVRPTSETIMYPTYAKWIRSWRDLPMRYNQWNNVVRWEFKHPTPLLRAREFLWNEGHTVFASKEEADAERDQILGIYKKVLEEYMALPGIIGRKTEKEKFAGAVASFSIEHILPDGYAIQGPDFHSDGQNFSKAFGISFIDKDGKRQYAWQNTFAISTRELGVMIATHGDNKGLVIPPKLAYIQVVIVPINPRGGSDEVMAYAKKLLGTLSAKFRAKIDDREGYTPGYKFNEWEMLGVPLRIEIGEKEMKKGEATLARRDNGEKMQASIDGIEGKVASVLEDMQHALYKKAEEFQRKNIHGVDTYEEFKKVLNEKRGMLHVPWCGETECEDKIKEETGTKATNIPLDQSDLHGRCIYCGKPAKYMVNFAKSY